MNSLAAMLRRKQCAGQPYYMHSTTVTSPPYIHNNSTIARQLFDVEMAGCLIEWLSNSKLSSR